LNREGYAFLHLPDGSMLGLIRPKRRKIAAVILLGSEGERETIAGSLEELLWMLANGETGLCDLDEAGAGGRGRLSKWLTRRNVTPPKAADFDFQAHLDRESAKKPPKAKQANKKKSAALPAGLSPFFRQIVSLVGLRTDDAALVAFITETLGKKVPTSMNDNSSTKYVTAPKLGIEMAFSHDLLHEAYPLLNKTKRSFIPYLDTVFLKAKFPDALPFGLQFGMTQEALSAALGEPTGTQGMLDIPIWERAMDDSRAIVLTISARGSFMLHVKTARALSSRHGVPASPVVGVFLGWAIQRDLLDQSALAPHRELIADIREQKKAANRAAGNRSP
jgi:hypothetical protein